MHAPLVTRRQAEDLAKRAADAARRDVSGALSPGGPVTTALPPPPDIPGFPLVTRRRALALAKSAREETARRVLSATLPAASPMLDGLTQVAASEAFRADPMLRSQFGEVLRANFDNALMPGVPTQLSPTNSPHPIYAFDRPYVYAVPQAPTRRPGQLLPVTTDTLRQLAHTYDLLRACILHLKREVWAVPIRFVPRDPKDKTAATKVAITEAKAAFGKQGGLGGQGRHRRDFESRILEDLLVIGAAAVYYSPTRGGRPYEALPVDAATIRPKVDAFGWQGPGSYIWEQWIYGVKVAEFDKNEVTFDGLWTTSYSPFPTSPVEYLLGTINSALRADDWNRSWLTDGNIPSMMLALPEGWSPEQIQSFSARFLDLYAGDSRARQQIRFVPAGTQKVGGDSRKDQEFKELELWLATRTCAIMGVQPSSLGLMGEQYKVAAKSMMSATTAFGVNCCLLFLKDAIYDDYLNRLGLYESIETRHIPAMEETASERADRNYLHVTMGVKTRNEARAEEGLDPLPDGDLLTVPHTTVPLDMILTAPALPEGSGNGVGAAGAGKDDNPLTPAKEASRPLSDSHGPPTSPKPPLPGAGGGMGKPPSPTAALRADLDQWEAACLQRLARGENAALAMPVQGIDPGAYLLLLRGLAEADDPETLRGLFDVARASDSLVRASLREAHAAPLPVTEATRTEVAASLARWERDCLRRLTEGRAAWSAPLSPGVPDALAASVLLSLRGATTTEAVKSVFRLVDMTPQPPPQPYGASASDCRIYLLRHAHTPQDGNRDVITAWQDARLDATGIRQAEAMATILKTLSISQLYTSDLARAFDTAKIACRGAGLTAPLPSDSWRPWDMGVLVGKDLEEVRDTLAYYVKTAPDEKIPAGESFNQFKGRLLASLVDLMNQFGASQMRVAETRAEFPGDLSVIGIMWHSRCSELVRAWMQAAGPPSAEVVPDDFLKLDAPSLLCLHRVSGQWRLETEIDAKEPASASAEPVAA